MLVELVDLTLLGKQLHWCVVGPLFRPVHLYLDDAIDAWRDAADAIAERAVALDEWPDGQAAAVASESGPGVPRGPIEDQAVLSALAGRLATVSELARTRIARIGALDPISEDVLVGVVRVLEEQLWMTRTQLCATAAAPRPTPARRDEVAA